jgi:predicted phage terminase large subunit-like protein
MLPMNQCLDIYKRLLSGTNEDEFIKISRELCKTDLFFLLTQICKRQDLIHEWYYARCREVEADPDGHLDLWSRGHGKSSIITFGLTLQDILKNPEIRIAIISHTRALAKRFLSQLKSELEKNVILKKLFSDILFDRPETESPRWSEDVGIIVKRKGNPKEATVYAAGIVEGMPTGAHFTHMVYDDLVTEVSVSTPEQIEKTLQCWELSLNLAEPNTKVRYIGTKYHYNDLYTAILDRQTAIPRIRVGVVNSKPILWSEDYMNERRRDLGPYTFAAQILLDPAAEQNAIFKESWLRYYGKKEGTGKYNKYIIVDPANTKNKRSDYTAIVVIGTGADQNFYVLDIIRDKLSLTERTDVLFQLYQEYHPIRVGYEAYGKDADIDHILYRQKQEQFRFEIQPLKGNMAKKDRIGKLVPLFEQGRIYLPYDREIIHKNWEGKDYYPTKLFVDGEYLTFPFCSHDDLLDVLSRIVDQDMNIKFPFLRENQKVGSNKPQFTKSYNMFKIAR